MKLAGKEIEKELNALKEKRAEQEKHLALNQQEYRILQERFENTKYLLFLFRDFPLVCLFCKNDDTSTFIKCHKNIWSNYIIKTLLTLQGPFGGICAKVERNRRSSEQK